VTDLPAKLNELPPTGRQVANPVLIIRAIANGRISIRHERRLLCYIRSKAY